MVINVVLVIHALSVLFRVALCLLPVEPVLSLGLGKLVNLKLSVSLLRHKKIESKHTSAPAKPASSSLAN